MSTTLMRTISVTSPRVHGSPTSCATTPGASAPTGRSTSRATAGASASRYAMCPSPGDAGGPARTDAAMRLPEAFRSPRYRDFRVFFVAQTISQIATWMHSVAQTWLILSLTNSPLLLGLITMLHWGPILLLALPSGAVADRVAKRRLLIATQAAQACTALTVATLATVGVEGRPRRERQTTIRQDIAEGVTYALHTPEIRAVLGVLFVISFCVFNFSIWVPLLARNVLGQGAQGFGFLLAVVGVGAVCGAFTLGTVLSRRPALALLDASAAAACSVLLALSLIESVWLAAVALFLLGYTGVIASAGCQTSLQLRSSDDLRGRVMSLFTLIHGGCFPIAAPLIGAVAERSSVSAAFFVWGAGGLAALALLMGDRRRFDSRRSTLASTIDMKASTQ